MTSGDTGGQIRFLELLGTGFEEVNRHAEAMRFFEKPSSSQMRTRIPGFPSWLTKEKPRLWLLQEEQTRQSGFWRTHSRKPNHSGREGTNSKPA
jgi:hypothetical protein